jgi:hypothetical protein
MDRGMVVPEQQVAELPLMLVENFFILCDFEKLIEDVVTFLPFQTFNLRRHQPVHI